MSLSSGSVDHVHVQAPATPAPLLTVDQFMRTVLTAVLDTPVARRELAALFLAASAAWEVAVREHGWRRLPSSSSSPSSASSTPASPAAVHSGPPRRVRGRDVDASPRCAHEADGAVDADRASRDAEQRALAAFCTHAGHCCALCSPASAIEGPRYACVPCGMPLRSLCSSCRRRGVRCDGASGLRECRFVVYEHPWEADVEYAAGNPYAPPDVLKVPRAPLALGDEGPRVLHLHYVLYKMGYLKLGNECLRVGVFCKDTRSAVFRFQRDHQLVGELPPSVTVSTSATAVGGRRSPSPVPFAMEGAVQGAGPSGLVLPLAANDRDSHDSPADISLAQPWGQFRDQPGVFTALTRMTIVNIVKEVESRYSLLRCRESQHPGGTHLQTATAA